jgi:hypothetical protein
LSLEKKQQSSFKVGCGNGDVTEGETIRRQTTTTEKKHNNQIMRGCNSDSDGNSNDHEDMKQQCQR